MAINSSDADIDAGMVEEVVEIALVDQSGSLLLHTFVQPVKSGTTEASDLQNKLSFSAIYPDVVDILGSAENVVVHQARYVNHVVGNSAMLYGLDRPNYKTIGLQSMASKMGIYAGWEGIKEFCWYIARINTNHLPDDAAGDAERIRLIHWYLLQEQARKRKAAKAREKRESRKLALVPNNTRDFPYFGQNDRPKGYKTTSQLRICDLPHYEFAGACCDTYGNLGYLFKPKGV